MLKDIIAYEEKTEKQYKKEKYEDTSPWWEWADIPVDWQIVRKLILAKVVIKAGKKYYLLKDRKATKRLLSKSGKDRTKSLSSRSARNEKLGSFPPNLFDVIEGFDDIKEFIKIVLKSKEPVHVLLEGAPGTAKSLFLMEIERLNASFIPAGSATKVGIRDLIFDELPTILLIDEIEKIGKSGDLSTLLTWMESGRVFITKHGMREERQGKGWVFAACNTTKRLSPELLDRFQRFKIKPYGSEQFIRVVSNYLHKRKGVKKSLAKYIAIQVEDYSVSVREAIRVANLVKTKADVDVVIKTIRKYS